MLLKKTSALEAEINAYFDAIVKSALLYELAVQDYIRNDTDSFQNRVDEIVQLESTSDDLRREIRYKLYTRMLIPEARGDVLSLLENIDNVVDTIKEVVTELEVQFPVFPEYLQQGIADISRATVLCVEHIVHAGVAFFTDFQQVNTNVNKVYFYEHEVDSLQVKLRRAIYRSDEKKLSVKNQLGYFINIMADISDQSEAVAERISVAAIKRDM